jgi:midasin
MGDNFCVPCLQIWVPSITDESELLAILESRLATSVIVKSVISHHLLAFWRLYLSQVPAAARGGLSIRDLLAWVGFINATSQNLGPLSAYAHGAYLTLLDGLGLGLGIPHNVLAPLKQHCRQLLQKQLSSVPVEAVANVMQQQQQHQAVVQFPPGQAAAVVAEAAGDLPVLSGTAGAAPPAAVDVITEDGRWGIPPFFVVRAASSTSSSNSSNSSTGSKFNWGAPTTCRNAYRLLRAMQVGLRWGSSHIKCCINSSTQLSPLKALV